MLKKFLKSTNPWVVRMKVIFVICIFPLLLPNIVYNQFNGLWYELWCGFIRTGDALSKLTKGLFKALVTGKIQKLW